MSGYSVTMRTIRYGHSADQEADLYLPRKPCPAVVCLLHGGFWKMPYGREQMHDVARDLASCGLAVWNVGYRRVGSGNPGWPATMEDVASGIDHLARLAADGIDLDLDRVVVVGHSAGGHLALWSAGRRRREGSGDRAPTLRAAVGLAPIADFALAHERGVGGSAVSDLLGGPRSEHPERWRSASPSEMLPLGVPQLILHGTVDDEVPIDLSRRYARAAARAGDRIELVELVGTGHMEYLDPTGEAHATLRRWVLATLGENPDPASDP